jgi:hypothetical protein
MLLSFVVPLDWNVVFHEAISEVVVLLSDDLKLSGEVISLSPDPLCHGLSPLPLLMASICFGICGLNPVIEFIDKLSKSLIDDSLNVSLGLGLARPGREYARSHGNANGADRGPDGSWDIVYLHLVF